MGSKQVPYECWAIKLKERALDREMEVKLTKTHLEEAHREAEQLGKNLYKGSLLAFIDFWW